MSRGKRKILIYLIVAFFVTVIFRSVVNAPIGGIETLKQWFVSFFVSLGLDFAWENMGK
jgi:TRAP-type C4-dicarboxylate transport system permease small subunit